MNVKNNIYIYGKRGGWEVDYTLWLQRSCLPVLLGCLQTSSGCLHRHYVHKGLVLNRQGGFLQHQSAEVQSSLSHADTYNTPPFQLYCAWRAPYSRSCCLGQSTAHLAAHHPNVTAQKNSCLFRVPNTWSYGGSGDYAEIFCCFLFSSNSVPEGRIINVTCGFYLLTHPISWVWSEPLLGLSVQ